MGSTLQPIVAVSGLTRMFQAGSPGLLDRVLFNRDPETILAVDNIDFEIQEGEIIGLVGESGCGKSTTAKMISGTLEPTDGTVRYKGEDVHGMDSTQKKEYTLDCQMIFQDPYESLNPTFTVFEYIAEPLKVHGDDSSEEIEETVYETLDMLGMAPEEYYDKYPHELSGGEKQRVHIASALVLNPSVLICDEPTSMLDVSVRSNILDELIKINEELGVTIVFISHDIALTAYLCDRIFVMYAGDIVEKGLAEEITGDPKHPYTQTLINAVPSAVPGVNRQRIKVENQEVENTMQNGGGKLCKYHDRCPEEMDVCTEKRPELVEREGTNRPVACHLYEPPGAEGESVPVNDAME